MQFDDTEDLQSFGYGVESSSWGLWGLRICLVAASVFSSLILFSVGFVAITARAIAFSLPNLLFLFHSTFVYDNLSMLPFGPLTTIMTAYL